MSCVMLGVISRVGGIWPDTYLRQRFRDRWLYLHPGGPRTLATLAVELLPGEQAIAAAEVLRRFLSAASWSAQVGLDEEIWWTVTPSLNHRPFGRTSGNPWLGESRSPRSATALWAPEARSREGELALALYRQGKCASPTVFRYLSYFKILEIRARGKRAIIDLAERHLVKVLASFSESEIAANEWQDLPELARRLYEDGRCAIAHANSDPRVDPDDPKATGEIGRDVWLVERLAEVFIEDELGVPRWTPREGLPRWERLSGDGGDT